MGMRARVIAVVSTVIIVMAVVAYFAASSLVSRTLDRREEMEVSDTLARAGAAIDMSVAQLSRTARDWGMWDDTYRYMGTLDPAYVRSNLSGTALSALDVDFMALVDREGNLIRAIGADPTRSRVAPVPTRVPRYLEDHRSLVLEAGGGTPIAGLVDIGGTPTFISMHPITTSDGTSPSRGTFVIGAAVSSVDARAIQRAIGQRVQIIPAATRLDSAGWVRPAEGDGFKMREVDARTIAGRAVHYGIDGAPAATVEVTQPRTTRTLVLESRSAVALTALAITVVLILAIYHAMNRLVLERLARLGTEVNAVAVGGSEGRVHVSGTDEISTLSRGINDMLDALHESQCEVRYLAEHDVLTGLANRRRFEQELDRELAASRRFGRPLAVLWFDLDHFKDVNDSFGHAAGDRLLAMVSDTLRRETREYSTVARIGGDEFAILIPEADETEGLAAARRVAESVNSARYELVGRFPHVHVSAGVATYPGDAQNADELLACADLAMYHAKSTGGRRVCPYSAEAHDKLNERMAWVERVREALRDERFVLHAMPSRNLATGGDGAFELLLRMVEPDGTLVGPGAFIGAAENSGLINSIDEWVARQAIQLLRGEHAMGRSTCFAINVSTAGLTSPTFVALIRDEAAAGGFDPSRLTIEITETAAVTDLEMARGFIDQLKSLGCRFALDDFGTGTASFYYLKHLPVDLLKIDGGLIRGLGRPEGDQYFVAAIVEMCRGLGIRTVAEYVETEELLAHVCAAGIDYAQGYVISQPQPLEALGIGPEAGISREAHVHARRHGESAYRGAAGLNGA